MQFSKLLKKYFSTFRPKLETANPSIFSFHKLLHSRKISGQTNELFLRKTVNRQTGRQKDRVDFVGHLCLALVQKWSLSDHYSSVHEPTMVIKAH